MQKTTLTPADCAALVPEVAHSLNPNIWVYRYQHPTRDWTLSIATMAPKGSGKLSMGGFRIAPLERTQSAGFTPDREAIALAMGMEEKVHWSRVIGVGGPLAKRDLSRLVGGKCVLAPTADARVGNPQDKELIEWAAACFNDCESTIGIHVTTGQDLGHGVMSDGKTGSLEYLHRHFAGSVVADTSVPTGEGNYRVLEGMLRAFDLPLHKATVGLIGCGNIGMHIIKRLLDDHKGVTLLTCESREQRRTELEAMGLKSWAAESKREFLTQPMDALVVNAAGGTLDPSTIAACVSNPRLKVICGSENLVMPEPETGEPALRDAKKVFAPTELAGMMGYLTAAEEHLSRIEGVPFDVGTLLTAAQRLEEAGYEVTARIIAGGHRETFEEAVVKIYH